MYSYKSEGILNPYMRIQFLYTSKASRVCSDWCEGINLLLSMCYWKEVLASKAEVWFLTELLPSSPPSFCLLNSFSWSDLLPDGSLPLTCSTLSSSEDEADSQEGNTWGWSPWWSQDSLLSLEDPHHGASPKSMHQAICIPTSALKDTVCPSMETISSSTKASGTAWGGRWAASASLCWSGQKTALPEIWHHLTPCRNRPHPH